MTSVKNAIAVLLFLFSLKAMADNWGENWGSLLWGAGSSAARAIPVDSLWMLVTASLLVAVVGALKMRKK